MDVEDMVKDVESFEEAIVKVQNDFVKGNATETEVHAAAVELVDKVCVNLRQEKQMQHG